MAGRRSGVIAHAPALGDILAALPVAVLLIDPAGRIAQVNAAGEQLLNRSERALAGRAVADVLPLSTGALRRSVAAFDAALVLDGRSLRLDVATAELPESPGWLAMTLHRHPTDAGPDRASGGRAAVGAAAMLAHEIKNPLSGIRGAAQLIARGAAPAELTALIATEVDRVVALIDRMEDFTDTRPLPLEPLNIYPLLARARDLASAGFARDIAIDCRFDPSLPPAYVNGDALVQVLLNLLTNAAAALEAVPDPRITLATAFRHGGAITGGAGHTRATLSIELAVIDNGPGVPAEIADCLFDPFVSGRREGKGLGLALVDKLVRDMGGSVAYTREGSPPRSVFRLMLARARL